MRAILRDPDLVFVVLLSVFAIVVGLAAFVIVIAHIL